MAIGTGATILFFGTEDKITVTTPGAVNAGAFSVTGDVDDWTNDDDAMHAMFKLKLTAAGLSAAPAAGAVVQLFARLIDVESTEDMPAPATGYEQVYLGAFTVQPSDADQVHVIGPLRLPNYETSQVYEFFIKSQMLVNIASDGWDLWITPVAFGPHA